MNIDHSDCSWFSSLSINVCKIVLAISPSPLPTKTNPSARAAIDATSIVFVSSATCGISFARISCRFEPVYAIAIPFIAAILSAAEALSTWSSSSANATSGSTRRPECRIPIASKAPALMCSSDEYEYLSIWSIPASESQSKDIPIEAVADIIPWSLFL